MVYSLKGQKLYINLRVFIAPDYQESWSKVLVSIDNISEYKQEEEKRLKLEMHLQQKQKMEAIGTLAGGVAHDFNNLLFAMLGNVTMALKNLPPDSKIEENLQDSLIAIRRAKALVLQILAFSRQQNTERVPLEIGPVVKESLKMMRSTLPSTIDIQQDIEAEQPPILADPTQIHQIVVNLCTNAGYMMQEQGGTLGVKLETIQPDETLKTLHGLSEDCYLKLTVSDTGAGIPPEIQERVFEPFFTTKPIGEGTGMGLAVVHGIMSNHEGGVTVFSEPGKGARFEVFFPAIETEDVAEEVFDFGPEGIQKGKILVVDDEPALVRVEQQILINFGYDVIVSTSSVEALELFRSQPDQFDMLITDHEMPEMPGLQLAEEILQLRPDLPVLLVVGSERLISREQALAKGVHAYLIKPVEADHFGNIVQRALV